MMIEVAVARDFNPYPGGRHRRQGEGSGEEFRDKFLLPHLRKGESVKVVLDGAAGFPPSFLEEAFGGLLRNGLRLEQVKALLDIAAAEPGNEVYSDEAWQYIEDAAKKLH